MVAHYPTVPSDLFYKVCLISLSSRSVVVQPVWSGRARKKEAGVGRKFDTTGPRFSFLLFHAGLKTSMVSSCSRAKPTAVASVNVRVWGLPYAHVA